jgi:hypothetical protein
MRDLDQNPLGVNEHISARHLKVIDEMVPVAVE